MARVGSELEVRGFTDPATAVAQDNKPPTMIKFFSIEFDGEGDTYYVETGDASVDEDAEMQPVP